MITMLPGREREPGPLGKLVGPEPGDQLLSSAV